MERNGTCFSGFHMPVHAAPAMFTASLQTLATAQAFLPVTLRMLVDRQKLCSAIDCS